MSRIAVVGAGPVGLFLACLLVHSGHDVTVLERRRERQHGSRSIGIHPPALEALDLVNAAAPLIACGVAIARARLFLDRRELGVLSLASCPPPYRFVLSSPQGATEAVLEECLEELAPGTIRRGVELEAVGRQGAGVRLELAGERGVEVDFVVGCDGRSSSVRESVGVDVEVRPHADHYLMADIADDSDLATDAVIFLTGSGVVESFPLPGSRRRWVVRTGGRGETPTFAHLAELVFQRTGVSLLREPARHEPAKMAPAPPHELAATVSAFSAETRLARRLAGRNWALAGDAAHVISPIGGQGMNLGWLGALTLASELADGSGAWHPERYQRLQWGRARAAARRVRLNTALGRAGLPGPLRQLALRLVMSRPVRTGAARYFTMRGL
ncbi:MAG: NAD(P)/FAD-dependent oxidoreductase [Trueperaceae bacterium]